MDAFGTSENHNTTTTTKLFPLKRPHCLTFSPGYSVYLGNFKYLRKLSYHPLDTLFLISITITPTRLVNFQLTNFPNMCLCLTENTLSCITQLHYLQLPNSFYPSLILNLSFTSNCSLSLSLFINLSITLE